MRLSPGKPADGYGAPGGAARRARERVDTRPSRPSPSKRRRRRRVSGKNVFICLLILGLGTWTYWASQRPGGISGTVNGWISHVRGDVASVSSDPDTAKARRYYQAQYKATGVYPLMSDNDLTTVGIGVGVTVDWCTAHAVVIQGAVGGGFASRLLLNGQDLGEVQGQVGCPNDLADPLPWTFPKK